MIKYTVLSSNGDIELFSPNSTTLVFRIPYTHLLSRSISFTIPNRFIVYILFGRNAQGKDMIYVGKSKNGIDRRPTSHTDKFNDWTTCYVLTQTTDSGYSSFLNDGVIQHIEHTLDEHINTCQLYCNTTETTTTGTANRAEEEDSKVFIQEALDMLYALGLDLSPHSSQNKKEEKTTPAAPVLPTSTSTVPDGIYYFKKKNKATGQIITATMQVQNGIYTVQDGSMVCPNESAGLPSPIRKMRQDAPILQDILQQPVPFTSPSAAGKFVSGGSVDGWIVWKTQKGDPIDIFRGMAQRK